MKTREEKDTLGRVQIPEDKMWGAQTARSLENFKIGKETIPQEMIWALALIKKCVAKINYDLGLIEWEKSEAIGQAAIEVMEGRWKEHFPLVIWQTGSGTQTNMNVNEVIANRGIQLLDGKVGDRNVLHPNDDVNKSQSSNDVFPTAMHLATVHVLKTSFLPALKEFKETLIEKQKEFESVIKIGRTHLMDATPISFGQEFSSYVFQIEKCEYFINESLKDLHELPLGGTAVGTGLNTLKTFDEKVVEQINKETGRNFVVSKNKFESISAHRALVQLSGSLKTLCTSLTKIAQDIRLMGSGPRCGLGELILPTNEPGSSIMPGKVNPTQCEALTMVCAQVVGNDMAVSLGGMDGHFELNAYKPLIIRNILHSLDILSGSLLSFSQKCLKGLKINKEQVKQNTERCLMLITALAPHIGYDVSAQVVKSAFQNNTTLKEETLKVTQLSEKEFDQIMDIKKMTQASVSS